MSAETDRCCGPSCCGGESTENTASITVAVRQKYGSVASSGLSGEHAGVRAVAEAFGYSPQELASIPAEANMGLSCGNPVALANLKAGEVVLDLGSGGGLDVFLAAQKVGRTGKAIGVDMTPSMVERARRAAAAGVKGEAINNVEFHLSTIDKLPLPDQSVDVITSNCVINLAPDKRAVFREMFRVLRPGGRIAISDIALKRPLPSTIARDVMAYVGCIAGAISFEEYEASLRNTGFAEVAVVDAKADLNAYSKVDGQTACCAPTAEKPGDCCTPASVQSVKAEVHDHLRQLLERYDINEYAASVKVFAIRAA